MLSISCQSGACGRSRRAPAPHALRRGHHAHAQDPGHAWERPCGAVGVAAPHLQVPQQGARDGQVPRGAALRGAMAAPLPQSERDAPRPRAGPGLRRGQSLDGGHEGLRQRRGFWKGRCPTFRPDTEIIGVDHVCLRRAWSSRRVECAGIGGKDPRFPERDKPDVRAWRVRLCQDPLLETQFNSTANDELDRLAPRQKNFYDNLFASMKGTNGLRIIFGHAAKIISIVIDVIKPPCDDS